MNSDSFLLLVNAYSVKTRQYNESMTYQDARQRPPPQTDVTSREQQSHDGHADQHQQAQQGGDQRVCRERTGSQKHSQVN